MVHALLVLAAEEAEPSKASFYICGGLLAGWAVVLGLVGLRSPDFPGGESGARAVMLITTVLMAGAMVTSVITA
jgi:hypothetical protein